jgi:phosphatidate cytidylyltransferase
MGEPVPVRPRALGDPILKKRVVSVLVLGPVALGLVVLGGQVFAVFIAAFAAAMAWEWVRMTDPGAPPRAFVLAIGTSVGATLLALQDAQIWTVMWALAGAIFCALDRRPRGDARYAFAGVLYVSVSAALLVTLRNGDTGGLGATLFLLAVVWSADTFAYLGGVWMGGPKLLPAASPNKTWAGLIAGLCLGVAAGVAVAYAYDMTPLRAGLIAAPTAFAAVLGDLLMSLAKRRFGVKDAGTLIPGHGGVLDRVDALMLASVFAGLTVALAPQVWPGAGL